MIGRRRFKHTQTLTQRLAIEAESARQRAKGLPPGREREELLRKARNADIAAYMDDWLRSPGLQPPD